jgi:hypothetical protein
MLLEKQREMLTSLGPFERAKTNLEKFAWNYMILYTVTTLVKTYQYIDDNNDKELQLTKITADTTLRGVFELVLQKNNNIWD